MKKYEINKDGRVVALKDFGDVHKGDIGGYVDSERNLSYSGNAWVFGNARVPKAADYICICPIGSRNDVLTICRTEDGAGSVVAGCFRGTIEAFLAAVEKTHGDNIHGKMYRLAVDMFRLRSADNDR